MADGPSIAHVSINAAGEITAFDPGAEAVFGHRAEDVLGTPMAEIIIPEPLREAHHDGMARFLRTREPFLIGRTVDITAQHNDGTVFRVELTLQIEADDPLVITGTIRPLED